MKLLFLLILFTNLVFSAKANTYTIQGVVYDEQNSPLPDANVRIKELNVSTVSNANGRYVFHNVPQGEYTVIVSYLGFATQTKQITIDNKTANLHFQLQKQTDLIDEVVVTATGTMHHIRNAPVMTEVIGRKFLSMYSGQSIEDILAGISPSFDFNQNIMGSNIKMNGLGNDYILILINGERIHGDVGGQNNLSLINPADIQKIEIVKGASSSLYGSDAIAGVINIITKKPRSKIELRNTTRIASYNSIQQNNMLSLAKGKWRTTTNFNFKHTNGWQNTNKERYRKKIYENSVSNTVNQFSDYKIAEKIIYTHNKKLSANISAEIYKKTIERPCGIPQYVTYGMMYKSQAYSARAKYSFNTNNYLKFTTNYKQTQYFHKYTEITEDKHVLANGTIIHPIYYPNDIFRVNTQQRLMLQTKGVFTVGNKQTLSSGLEFRKDWLSSPYRLLSNNESDYSAAAYLQDEYNPFDNFNITVGTRLIMHERFGFHFTPKISLLQKIKAFNLRATWSQGFKTPTIKELHYHYKRAIMSKVRLFLGNKKLQPQTSNYFALASEYNTNKISVSITSYHNSLKNMITLIEIPTAYQDKLNDINKTMQYKNIEDAVTQGIDFIFKYKISRDISIGGGYSFLDAKGHLLNEDNIMETTKLNGTAKHHANMYAMWSHSWDNYKLGIGCFGKGQSKRFYREYGNADEYILFRVNTSHNILKIKHFELSANIGIDNILNYKETRPYGENYGTKTSGRTYYLSIIVKFKH